MGGLRNVRIPLRRKSLGVSLGHRTMATASPLDRFGIPDVEIPAVVEPQVTEPGCVRLHRAAFNEIFAIEGDQRRRMFELPEPLPFGNLTRHLFMEDLEHGDAGVGPHRFSGLHVLDQDGHESTRTVHAPLGPACDIHRPRLLNAAQVAHACHQFLRNRIEFGIADVGVAVAIPFY